MTRTAAIALTSEEQVLFDQVTFCYDELGDGDIDANGEAVAGEHQRTLRSGPRSVPWLGGRGS